MFCQYLLLILDLRRLSWNIKYDITFKEVALIVKATFKIAVENPLFTK